jgi:hypothetical protein
MRNHFLTSLIVAMLTFAYVGDAYQRHSNQKQFPHRTLLIMDLSREKPTRHFTDARESQPLLRLEAENRRIRETPEFLEWYRRSHIVESKEDRVKKAALKRRGFTDKEIDDAMRENRLSFPPMHNLGFQWQ